MREDIQIDDIAVMVRRNARARRMTLRVSRTDGGVVLTLPPRVSLKAAQDFASSKADWLRRAVDAMPGPQLVAEGARLPVAGREVTLRSLPIRRVTFDRDVLGVPVGKPIGASVQAWLKQRAHVSLIEAVGRHAANLGRQPTAISLRDTRSRWGSCTSDGRLMFSWRLAMAPIEVLDYVAAHEVAHLAHMDHSPRFWAQVEALMPGYAPYRTWLRQNGSGLQAWRFRD
ncbi:M48 family metallopeptidase [Paracoccus aurantiacus]|uniref:M48 family metallopeptidase n=1 Tax=Paracoccus aurantiacus TaxID=2599412 RepID=A0A5C6S7P7_9RHOB|nr:SprT family zinc-dependent metalloprotease [Paracoccus aurantiacus]TXB70374.1 M48 family metallopeptidase [Paracoccus aurantiacus]